MGGEVMVGLVTTAGEVETGSTGVEEVGMMTGEEVPMAGELVVEDVEVGEAVEVVTGEGVVVEREEAPPIEWKISCPFLCPGDTQASAFNRSR